MEFLIQWFLEGFAQSSTTGLVLYAIASSYCILMLFLIVGVLLNRPTQRVTLADKDLPSITVLVSARNEEEDFQECIDALANLNYPSDKLQVILVNDRSEDRTPQIINAAVSKYPHFMGLDTINMGETTLEAKSRGIGYGFRYATGDWVFITDADATVHPDWILHSLSKVNSKTGMIGGTLMVKPKGLVGMVERVSWALAQMFNIGMAGYGIPFICVGPNMAIRREIYEQAGGLEHVDFKVAEDLALFQMVMKAGYSIKTYFSAETMARLTPVPSFNHLFSQQHRWFRGGLDGGLDYIFMLFLTFSWGFVVMGFIWVGWLFSLPLFVLFTLQRLIVDGLFLFIQQKRLHLKRHFLFLPILELYVPFFALVILPSFFVKKEIEWMGKNYKVTYKP